VTPTPSIVVNFRSYVAGLRRADQLFGRSRRHPCCGRAQGHARQVSARGDTMNFMAAIGPDFKAGYVDALPVSNADVGITIAQLMGLHAAGPRADFWAGVMSEALPNGITPKAADGKDRLQAGRERPANHRQIPAALRSPTLFRRRGL